MFNTPIIFLTYKRPRETQKILNILIKINPKKIYIFQDGVKKNFTKIDKKNHFETKEIIKKFNKVKSKKKFYKINLGQKRIGYEMLKNVFNNEDRCIILEDDCIPELGFFKYCNLMLKKYNKDNTIAHISGCNLYYGVFKKKIDNNDYLFSKFPQFMGWATWRDRWQKYYDPNIEDWPKNKRKFLNKASLKKGEKRFFKYYLNKIYNNKNLSIWDTQWAYYNLLHDLKTIVPGVNLIKNIGFNSAPTGQSAKKFRNLFTKNIKFPLKTNNNKIFNSKYDKYLYDNFYNRKSLINRIFNKLKLKLKYF